MQSGQREASAFKFSFILSLLGAPVDGLSIIDTLSWLDSLSRLNTRYSIPCFVPPNRRSVFSISPLPMSFFTARRIDVSGTPERSASFGLEMKHMSLPQPQLSR